MSNSRFHKFSARLPLVPQKPGIYIHYGKKRRVLYVGKSASLRNRLKSYFINYSSQPDKIRHMLKLVVDFEYVVTESEQEALLLENNLIKEHKPPYNARLKDDKAYPFIKIDLREDFPRVYVTRRNENDGAKYFGPFASAGSMRKTLALLKRLFPYRSCTKRITGSDERPCLEYHIKRCVAPCTGYASQQEYGAVITQVMQFLDGDTKEIISALREEMLQASTNLEFERAAALRDRIRAIKKIYEGQRVVGLGNKSLDAIGVASGSDQACVEIFFVRGGSVVNRDEFVMEGTRDISEAEILAIFIAQFYHTASYIPPVIAMPMEVPNTTILSQWLQQRRNAKVRLVQPKQGAKHQLLKMVAENATHGLQQLNIRRLTKHSNFELLLSDLQEKLELPELPARIECYDVSHVQGSHVVASMAVFENSLPRPAEYRRFKIKNKQSNDDFESMREILYRRFRRMRNDIAENGRAPRSGGFSKRPQLVLIDGGRGQLNAALEVLLKMGLADIPLASLAKREEEIYRPDLPEPIHMPRDAEVLMLLQQLRDEAHRFAITYHRNVRSKAAIRSALDDIPGVGPKRRGALIRRFGSVGNIRRASLKELAATPTMTLALARCIKLSL